MYDHRNERSTKTIGEVEALERRAADAERALADARKTISTPLQMATLDCLRHLLLEAIATGCMKDDFIMHAGAYLTELATELYIRRPVKLGPLAYFAASVASSRAFMHAIRLAGGELVMTDEDVATLANLEVVVERMQPSDGDAFARFKLVKVPT